MSTAPAGPETGERRRWWARTDVRVGLLAGGLGAVTAAGIAASAVSPRLPYEWAGFAVLIALFAATEGFVVHVRVRRGAHAVSLADVPMVLGLLAVPPGLVLLARVIGGSGGLFALRRQRGLKLAFNIALIGVQATVAVGTFRLFGAMPGQPGVREWIAAYAATLLADVVAVVAVTAVIAFHDDPQEWRRLPAAMRSVPVSAIAATAALVSTRAAAGNPWVLALLALLAVAVHVAYRAFVQQRQGKEEVEQLFAFTRAINGADDLDDVLPVVLDRVRDQLRAGMAELVIAEGDAIVRMGTLRTSTAPAGDDGWLRPALAGQPTLHEPVGAMAVPVVIGDSTAALVVAQSLPDAGPFTEARLHLLEALANHAGIALTKADLVERLRRKAAEKEFLALYDSLSGLPNRRHFHSLLDAALQDGASLAVLMLDIDRFKEMNDALGHETGDALLVRIAGRLQEHVGDRGVVARMGGDEFAVLLPTDASTAGAVAETTALAAVIERPLTLGPLTLHVRASIGVALAPAHGADAQSLVRHADVAMYAAKQHRSGVEVYDPTTDSNTPQRLALIADLRLAVERRELLVAFQPKVDPASGVVIGAEALARWRHPMHGAVPPDEFIPLAEHSGLIRPLTFQVLETALRQRARWARGGHELHVAVNLSPNSLSDGALPEAVSRLLTETSTPPEMLTLEITESTLMTDPAGGLATLVKLEALGVRLSIDDFGTGYSSLDRLRRLPIHEVKIDRSFVQRLAVDHRDRALVCSAIQMGHALDLTVVAEGVEDAETMTYLATVECDTIQGFHISRPLLPDDFAAWLGRYADGRVAQLIQPG
jgi:diguanylate cyclase (GGDEF)-like protein